MLAVYNAAYPPRVYYPEDLYNVELQQNLDDDLEAHTWTDTAQVTAFSCACFSNLDCLKFKSLTVLV